MSDDHDEPDAENGNEASSRDTPSRPVGTDSDDTTQADAGMVGGTGAAPTEGTRQPLGTEPHEDEETTRRKE